MTTREAIIAALTGKGWRRGADVIKDVCIRGCTGSAGRRPRHNAQVVLSNMVKAGEVKKQAVDGWTTANGGQVYAYKLVEGACCSAT